MTAPDIPALIARLQTCDTPTVCNAIEVAQGRRGFSGFTHRTVQWAGDPDARIVGFARTARISGNLPPTAPTEEIRARRMAYFEAMNSGARPGVAVIEDLDGDAALGAWWGEVHAQIHKNVFALGGAVTNGVMRDLGDIPDGFPILAGSVGPSHGFVHVHDIGTPVTVFGMRVAQGDLIHADRHGAVCVPVDVIPLLQDALDRLFAAEAVVLDAVGNGPVDFETFKDLWAKFEKART
ncbi:RraA family protein [Jannaschia sp. M317]|uniref:RraA family protein n=1 Tax=Jannaschia sp. M317 TaxID=2867011 RepID=UPI0021A4D93D|nr:RraA family protein [Jannaschia sp. M317]UWQ19116.1 RraA family protein [Jannaschia sp. M317]